MYVYTFETESQVAEGRVEHDIQMRPLLHFSKAETKCVRHYAQLHSIFEYCPTMVLIQATFERGLGQWAQVRPTVRHIMHLTRHNYVVAVASVVAGVGGGVGQSSIL